MSEQSLTNAELAILSLIVEHDRYGYEIEQLLETRGMRAWTEVSFSSIYYLLKKLERKGLVSGKCQPPSGPGKARVVYRVLPPGRAALEQGVQEALSIPQSSPPAFLLGLANLPVLQKEEILNALTGYQQALNEREHDLQQARSNIGSSPYFVQAMFDYSLTLLQAEDSWVKRFQSTVEALDGKSGS